MKNKKTILESIKTFINEKAYFSVYALKSYLKQKGCSFKDQTVNQYLYRLRDIHKIYNSGYGWYSTISHNELDIGDDSISKLVQLISNQYPYLEFNIWSTRQLSNYFHHIPARHLILVYTDPEALRSIFDFLIDQGYTVYNNPTKEILNRHWLPEEETVILRPKITQSPVSGTGFLHFATIEKILVDLYLEKDRLMYMDEAEFERIVDNILFKNRLNIATLLRYAGRREVRTKFEKLLFRNHHLEVIKNPYHSVVS